MNSSLKNLQQMQTPPLLIKEQINSVPIHPEEDSPLIMESTAILDTI